MEVLESLISFPTKLKVNTGKLMSRVICLILSCRKPKIDRELKKLDFVSPFYFQTIFEHKINIIIENLGYFLKE